MQQNVPRTQPWVMPEEAEEGDDRRIFSKGAMTLECGVCI